MNNYMVDVHLPAVLTEEFISLIPRQRAHVDELMAEGVITSYALTENRSRLWITVSAGSREQVMKVVKGFPMIKFFTLEIHELMFQRLAGFVLPQMSLN
jgi:hypothetical protein